MKKESVTPLSEGKARRKPTSRKKPGPGPEEASRHQTVEDAVRGRDSILKAVASTAQSLLRSPDWKSALPEVLELIGKATGVSRALLFQGHLNPEGRTILSRIAGWRKEGAPFLSNDDRVVHVDLAQHGLANRIQVLASGQITFSLTRDLPPSDFRELRERQGLLSLVTVPIFVGGQLWGVLGLDDVLERIWELPEMEALRAAAGALGEAIRRHDAEAALRESEVRLRTLIEASPDVIQFKDGDGRWLAVNDAGLRAFGLSEFPWHGMTDLEIGRMRPECDEGLRNCLRTDQEAWERRGLLRAEEVVSLPGGKQQIFDVIKAPLFHPDGSRKGLVILGRDITDRVAAEKELHRNAFYDRLTGLPNRALLLDRLSVSLRRAEGRSSGACGVFYIDVDRFKNVNDGLGQRAGDALLREIPRRLEAALRADSTLSRIGADEFVAVVDDIGDAEEALRQAYRIRRSFEEPFLVDGKRIHVTASIGVALSQPEKKSAEDLVRNAHTALVRAKEAGRDAEALFDEDMQKKVLDRLELESALRKAIEREELVLHYQPIFDVDSRETIGFEALVRWLHPERGLILPADFIPLAEETGLIRPIGRWAMRQACQQLHRFLESSGRAMTMAVNCSPRQLVEPTFPDVVRGALLDAALPPGLLQIEITESTFMERPDMAALVLQQLRAIGVRTVLDDFGTGYSSLSYLLQYAVDAIKIDRAFVGALPNGTNATKIARTLLSLAQTLGISVTAEGVETEEQYEWLRERGCDYAQGHLFCKAVPASEITGLRRVPAGKRPGSGDIRAQIWDATQRK